MKLILYSNKDDPKIECLLPDCLNQLIQEGKLEMNLFSSPSPYIGITNPQDEKTVKNILKLLL